LRHAGNQFAADGAANLRELMDRMGHPTQTAIALYDSDERRQVIADALSSRAAAESNRSKSGPSGTQRARRRRKGAVSITGRLGDMCFELRFCRARQDSNPRPAA
jgi:hypothetical protein